MNVRDAAQVTAVTPVNGKPVRKTRTAARRRSSRVTHGGVPAATLKVAVEKAGGRVDLLRCVPEPGVLGGWAIMVFNSREQAREWDRNNK